MKLAMETRGQGSILNLRGLKVSSRSFQTSKWSWFRVSPVVINMKWTTLNPDTHWNGNKLIDSLCKLYTWVTQGILGGCAFHVCSFGICHVSWHVEKSSAGRNHVTNHQQQHHVPGQIFTDHSFIHKSFKTSSGLVKMMLCHYDKWFMFTFHFILEWFSGWSQVEHSGFRTFLNEANKWTTVSSPNEIMSIHINMLFTAVVL